MQLCVQLGCQLPHNIKTNMTTCQAHAARTQNQTYLVVFPAVERTEEKTDVFFLNAAAKTFRTNIDDLEEHLDLSCLWIWLFHSFPISFNNFQVFGSKIQMQTNISLSNLKVYYVVVGKIFFFFFLCQHNFILLYILPPFLASKSALGTLFFCKYLYCYYCKHEVWISSPKTHSSPLT